LEDWDIFVVRKNWILAGFLAAGMLAASMGTAHAVPKLQIYLEGADYDIATETWLVSGNSVRLWAIGDVDAAGPISDVRLSAAYDTGLTPTITLTGSAINPADFPGMTDPSNPGTASLNQTVTDGSAPLLGSGASLPSHGVFGAQTDWQEFALGDFTLTDSQIGDWIDAFPTSFPSMGQINVYDVEIAGLADGASVHFDLYDGIEGAHHAKFVFAPFSHDGGGSEDPLPVPEPAGLTLLAGGLFALSMIRRRRRV